jgi:hypothetical protein
MTMNKIWANRLIAGTKTWEDVVKAGREEGVLEELKSRVENNQLSAEQFEVITGQTYA